MYDGKSKSKGTSEKIYMYCKDRKIELILFFNMISHDFNALYPTFHKFFESAREKSSVVARSTNFSLQQ
jgi:hypothetical protein